MIYSNHLQHKAAEVLGYETTLYTRKGNSDEDELIIFPVWRVRTGAVGGIITALGSRGVYIMWMG